MFAKEDSLLLPPEFMHDEERRCDSFRRYVLISETLPSPLHGMGGFNCLLHVVLCMIVSHTMLVLCNEIVGTSLTAVTCLAVCAATIVSLTTGPKCGSHRTLCFFTGQIMRCLFLTIAFSGWPLPRVVPSILYAAPHAQEGGTMAGLLLLVDGHVRAKSETRSLSLYYRCFSLGQYYKGWSTLWSESHSSSPAVDIGYYMVVAFFIAAAQLLLFCSSDYLNLNAF